MKLTTSTRRGIVLIIALSLIVTPVVAQEGLTGELPADPPDAGVQGWFEVNAPEQVLFGSNGNPRVIVTVDNSSDRSALENWINASSQRAWSDDIGPRTFVVSIPVSDVMPPRASIDGILGTGSYLERLSYVEGWSFDRPVRKPDTVFLAREGTYSESSEVRTAELLTSGTYEADGFAWQNESGSGNIADAAELVGANDVSQTGDNVTIAVIDTGVNTADGALFGNGTAGSDFRITDAYDFVEGQEVNTSVSRSSMPQELDKVRDPNGHGTWVASAAANSQTGIAPNASLLVYRTLDSSGRGSTTNIAKAVRRADNHGADIIVMSLGSVQYNEHLALTLAEATQHGNVTAAFVAAGNSYLTTHYLSSPADTPTPGVIAVSATNMNNSSTAEKAYFANVGPDSGTDGSPPGELSTRNVKVDTAAPGMNITAKVATDEEGSGLVYNKTLSGTSMAAPIAGGVGALILEADSSVKNDSEAFKELVVNSGAHTPNIGVTESRGGMINADRAINGYTGDDAPDRELDAPAKARDNGNDFLAGSPRTVGLFDGLIDGFSDIVGVAA